MRRSVAIAVCAAGSAVTLLVAGCSSSSGTATRDQSTKTVTVTESGEATTTVTVERTTTVAPPDASDETSSGDVPPTGSGNASTSTGADDACRTADLGVTLTESGAAAGSQYFDIVFTNTGDSPCSLQGFPKVEYVAGDEGTQIGAEATHDGDAGQVVIVKPSESASASLQEPNVMNYDPDSCDPVSVRGLRVYPPGASHAVFLPQENATGCKAATLPGGGSQLSVKAVSAGSSSQ